MKAAIRNLIGNTIAYAIILSGRVKKALRKLETEEGIVSLYYHAPSKELFESTTGWLKDNGFHFISIFDLEKIAKGEMAFPKKAALLTVDDGWQSNIDNVVPAAVKNNMPVTIFINPGVLQDGERYWWSYIYEANKAGLISTSVEHYKKISNDERLAAVAEIKKTIPVKREGLTIDQVKEMAKHKMVSICNHTVTHPILPMCSDEKSAYEIKASKKIVEDWTGIPVKHFSYPNGDYTNREIETLKQSDFTAAFTVEHKFITKDNLKDMYRLPRINIVESATLKENICRMMGVWIKKPDGQ